MRRAARTDANQAAIVRALESLGCTVQSLAAVGGGVPDLLIGWRGMCLLFEVKDGAKPPSERKLTPDQVRWHRDWRGQVTVVETVDDALQAVLRANAGLPEIPRAPLTQAAAPAGILPPHPAGGGSTSETETGPITQRGSEQWTRNRNRH